MVTKTIGSMAPGERRRLQGRRRWAAAVVLVALVAAGCGDDGSDEDAGADGGGTKREGVLEAGKGVRGVTDTTIKVGLVTYDTKARDEAVGSAAGAEDDFQISTDKRNRAAIEYVNRTGGIAGRQVELVEFGFDPKTLTSKSARQTENQRACSFFTEDNEVFAFSLSSLSDDVMLECAAKTKTIGVTAIYHANPSQSRFKAMSDYFYAPDNFVADRRDKALATFFTKRGFFDSGAKVALVIEDKPGIKESAEKALKPTLAAAGIKPVVEIFYPDPVESPWNNYILQMKQADVTHVVFSPMTLPVFPTSSLMTAAESQNFRPKWAGGSDNGPAGTHDLKAPKAQLANFRAMGWIPHPNDTDDASPQSEPARTCVEEMTKLGGTPNDFKVACDFVLFLRAGLEKADELSAKGFAEGVERLGDSYKSTMTIGGATQFGKGRHDGVTVVREVAYDATCDCMQYVSPPEPVPN